MVEVRGPSRADQVADVVNVDGASPLLLVCEHASNHIPDTYGRLGLDDATLLAHVAWDPGALAVASEMSALLDAPLVVQRVSRLLYDCNRPPESDSAIPATSEVHRIPGNERLSPAERADRAKRFYHPFRRLLAETIDRRAGTGLEPVIVTIHSFTPVYHGARREVEIGILHDDDARLADAMLAIAEPDGDVVVRRNEPYGPRDGVTHTLREHALPRGMLNVMIEIRNDLIAGPASQEAMANRLSVWLTGALGALDSNARPTRFAASGTASDRSMR